MKCRLCLQNKALIKAHIIPDFMHKPIYDEDHKLYKLNYSNPLRSKKISTGEYDNKVLCAECDNSISNFESYFSLLMHGGSLPIPELPQFNTVINQHGIKFTRILNVNYQKTKLFLLSVLWRASITTRPNFSDIKLSDSEEERIRVMLVNEDPGEVYDYPCLLLTYLDQKNMEPGLIGSPRRNLDNTRLTFLIHGMFYVYFISPNDIPYDLLNECTVDKNGIMSVVHMPESKALPFLKSFLCFEI